MQNNIQEILKELYKIDSSLQNKEEELTKAVKHLLEIKPNITVDEAFKKELQAEIQDKMLQKKLESFSKNKLSLFQIFSYIFGTLGMACFGFILLRENVRFSSKPIQIPIVQEKTGENITNTTEAIPGDMMVSRSVPVSEKKLSTTSKVKEIPPTVASENLKTTLKKELPPPENPQTESLSIEAPSQDDTSNTVDVNMMADSVPEGGAGLMKSSPMMAEYVQDVYIYSFTGEINISFDSQYETFKKGSNNIYFTPQKLELENNTENILKVALKGGKDGFLETPQSEKKREVHVVLKNPKVVYNTIYNFIGGNSVEYFAPTVVFDVASSDDPNFFQTQIEVPLIKEIYTYDENGKIIGLKQ